MDGITNLITPHIHKKIIKNIVIDADSFLPDSDIDVYPFFSDYDINDMLSTDDGRVDYSPDTLFMRCMAPQARTMDGKIRIYALNKPISDIVIESICYERMVI